MTSHKKIPQRLSRAFLLNRENIDEEARTVEFSFSSEEPYERFFGLEILDHSPGSVRLDRLRRAAPLLVNHNTDDQVGVIESVRIEDRKGRAVARFSRSARAEEIFQDMKDGIRLNISVGYFVHSIRLEEENEDSPSVYRVTDWEPLEVSTVPIPADTSVGLGRSGEDEDAPAELEVDPQPTPETTTPPMEETMPPDTPPAVTSTADAIAADRARAKTIRDLGRTWKHEALAEQHIDSGTSLEDFRVLLLERIGQDHKPLPIEPIPNKPRALGMNRKEVARFSFFRLLNYLADKTNARAAEEAAFEREACNAWAAVDNRATAGAFIPPDVLFDRNFVRALNVGTEGADLRPTDHGDFIDYLRAATPVTALATILPGLTADLLLPRQATASSAGFTTETGDGAEQTPTFDQVLLSPHSIRAYAEVTRRSLIQFNPAAEGLLRNDLFNALAAKIEDVAIEGAGSNEPTGILETAGIGSVTAASSGIAWEHIVNLEREVDVDNALIGRLAYFTNPLVRAQMKRTEIAAGSSGQMIFDRQTPTAPVNGYPLLVTNHVPSDLGAGNNLSAVGFGNLADLLIGLWDMIEIIVNPYTKDTAGILRISIHHEMDVDVRRPQSFAACQDIDPTL